MLLGGSWHPNSDGPKLTNDHSVLGPNRRRSSVRHADPQPAHPITQSVVRVSCAPVLGLSGPFVSSRFCSPRHLASTTGVNVTAASSILPRWTAVPSPSQYCGPEMLLLAKSLSYIITGLDVSIASAPPVPAARFPSKNDSVISTAHVEPDMLGALRCVSVRAASTGT